MSSNNTQLAPNSEVWTKEVLTEWWVGGGEFLTITTLTEREQSIFQHKNSKHPTVRHLKILPAASKDINLSLCKIHHIFGH